MKLSSVFNYHEYFRNFMEQSDDVVMHVTNNTSLLTVCQSKEIAPS